MKRSRQRPAPCRKGARNVLVSMAGDGALLLDEQGRCTASAAPRQGGQQRGRRRQHGSRFCGRLAADPQLCRCLRLGTACGSATAFSLGLATKEKIDELLAQL